MSDNHLYLCIDLKSFYASVECVLRGLDPMTTNLVVADLNRSSRTICLAVTPAMKALGVKNRCRVFEIPDNIEYIAAVPRMKKYIEYSADIYAIYLKYFSKNDIHVYSIDEVFIDVTTYLALYNISAYSLAKKVMKDIYDTMGIRATCGIGTNLYLAKIALDLTAKHSKDFIGGLNERLFCHKLWDYTPLSDFWRIGKATADTLAKYGIRTMRQIACADEEFLYRIFGVDAELLIDHSRGIEPVTIADIKKYMPRTNSLTSGQVLMRNYTFDEGIVIVKEMMDALCLDMVDKKLVTKSITLNVGYAREYGMESAHKSTQLLVETNADSIMIPAVVDLYKEIVNPNICVRRINISCNQVVSEGDYQYSLFVKEDELEKSRRVQEAVISIKKKYGKNAVLRGINYDEASTARDRNLQIGGHKSGEETKK